jgi:hypothetical protein
VSDPQPHHSFPWRVTGIVALVVIAATVVAGLLLARERVGPDPAPRPTPSPSATATSELRLEDQQLTVLLTVRDADRAAVSNVLIGVGGDLGFASELMLPRDLLLPTVPPMRLGEVDDPTGAQTAEQPLETLLGVRVDALVDLDRLAWAGLIDATGSRVDLVAAENPGSFALVLDRVLKGLPYEPETVGELLTGLGSMARTTVTNEDASYLLSLVGRNLRSEDLKRAVLPVTYLRSGESRVAVVDPSAADAVVRDLFPQALLTPGHSGQPRVVLQRAGATLGATTAARIELQNAGFGVVDDRAELELAAGTSVVVPDSSEDSMAAGRDAASALGLPATAVVVSDDPDATVDVRVVLGPDAGVKAP